MVQKLHCNILFLLLTKFWQFLLYGAFIMVKFFTLPTASWQHFAVVLFSTLMFVTLSAQSGEYNAQVYYGANNAKGYSFQYSDNLAKKMNLRWGAAISSIDDIELERSNEVIAFNTNTLDFHLGYRYFPSNYQAFWRRFNIELQAGASFSLTENKYTFQNFPNQEVVLSKQGDINLFFATHLQFQVSNKMQLQLGYKAYPSFSEFGNVNLVTFGLTYQLGRNLRY